MRTESLLRKLQLQEQAAAELAWRKRKYEASHPAVTAEVVEEQKLDRLVNLRKKTAEIQFQLELDRQLETESKKNLEATMKLRESRLTPAERKAREAETLRGQILFSKLIPELSPTWRQQASESFRNRKL
jgi:hypothetical protein